MLHKHLKNIKRTSQYNFDRTYFLRMDANERVKPFEKKIEYDGKKNSIRKYINVIDAAKATSNIISPKYKNKYVNITGKKSYKVSQY